MHQPYGPEDKGLKPPGGTAERSSNGEVQAIRAKPSPTRHMLQRGIQALGMVGMAATAVAQQHLGFTVSPMAGLACFVIDTSIMHLNVLQTQLRNKVGQVLGTSALHYGQHTLFKRQPISKGSAQAIKLWALYQNVLFVLNVQPPPAGQAHVTDTISTQPCTTTTAIDGKIPNTKAKADETCVPLMGNT